MRALGEAPWLLLTLFAAGAWYLATERLMHRSGAHEAAAAAGLIVAFAVAVTLWRWGQHDRQRSALAAGRCPRCRRGLRSTHEHASTTEGRLGLVHWECRRCGFDRSEPLTCQSCEP